MALFSLAFSPSGRISPLTFAIAVVFVYVASFAARVLLSDKVTTPVGLPSAFG